jgi:hypothetical protein
MNWKKFPGWLKGGIIGLIILVVLFIPIWMDVKFSLLIALFIAVITGWAYECSFEGCFQMLSWGFIIAAIEFFLAGAFVSWIGEKIESKIKSIR